MIGVALSSFWSAGRGPASTVMSDREMHTVQSGLGGIMNMRKPHLLQAAGLVLLILALPNLLAAQGFGLAVRAGSLGLGGEAALGFSDQIVLRGGAGVLPEFEARYDGVKYTVTPPQLTGHLGVDVYPFAGSFRLMAGFILRDKEFEVEAPDLSDSDGVEIGNTIYNESGSLSGTLTTKSASPFIGVGFGHHTRGGFGLFLDLGVAFVGNPDVALTASGAIADVPGFQEDLNQEIQNLEDEASPYLRYWPLVSLGIKMPIR